MQPRSLKRTLALGLAACAIAPATAGAAPAIHAVGAGDGPGLTAQDVMAAQNVTPGLTAQDVMAAQNLIAADQVGHGTTKPTSPQRPAVPGGVTAVHHAKPSLPGPPTWPTNPRGGIVHPTSSAQPSDDGGLDTGGWIALGTAAFALAGGIGLAGSKRLRTGRQRQLA
jgi:hypothetical protein